MTTKFLNSSLLAKLQKSPEQKQVCSSTLVLSKQSNSRIECLHCVV